MQDYNKEKIRESQQKFWEQSWGRDDFSAPWMGRGISPEIVTMIQEGWFPSSGSVLDIGCGEGSVSHWFSQNGYDTVGIDISQSVIKKAISHYVTPETKRLQFLTLDITKEPPPDKKYEIIIDRGCLHAIHPSLVEGYINNLTKVCSSSARMLLYIRAFRNGITFKDQKELRFHLVNIKNIFNGTFDIKGYMVTNIGRTYGKKDDKWLPGIVFKLERVKRRL